MKMLRCAKTFIFVVCLLFVPIATAQVTPDRALSQVVAGNQRYVANKSIHDHQDVARRLEVAAGQKPIAAILSCADSRVPPEIIFDQGLGDLFVVRVAGQVLDDAVLASLEYAVQHLGVSLIVVLGHERCGAVTAAVTGAHLEGHLPLLVEKIRPVIKHKPGETPDVEQCISDNVRYIAKQLQESQQVFQEYLRSGKVKIVAGKYDLDTGVVEIF